MRKALSRGVGLVLASLLLSCIWQTSMASKRVLPQQKTVPGLVAFCDLVINPDKYNGKEITTRATYRYGFEWQEVFCLACEGKTKVWLEFSEDLTVKSKAALRKAPKNHGIINAVFTGTFRTSGPYGDGGYGFQLEVKDAKNVEVVSKDIEHQNLLPSNVRRRMCVVERRPRISAITSKHLAINPIKTSDA